jgi:SAM-dependent methyltransferase
MLMWSVTKNLNLGIFRFSPVFKEDDYSKSHLEKGKDYHDRFDRHVGRKLMMDFELPIINEYASSASSHLDFATGTGRIINAIKNQELLSYGIDVSKSMLKVAKENNPRAKLYCGNFYEGVPEVDGAKIDLITSFRFFPNADQKLRRDAMKYISSLSEFGGVLVINNHRNYWSIPFIFYRMFFLPYGQCGITHDQIVELAEQNGFELVTSKSFGVLPQNERKALFGWTITSWLEHKIYSITGGNHRLGYDVIYVFKKTR